MGARLALIVLAVWLTALSGCNTVHGVGRDIEAAGEAIQRKSR
jgi:predicted small secreted protein